jgi:hypothetical protein
MTVNIDWNQQLEFATNLKNILVAVATGRSFKEPALSDEYQDTRKAIQKHTEVWNRIPRCVKDSRELSEFWSYIQPKIATYTERRKFIADEFNEFLTWLESRGSISTSEFEISSVLQNFDSNEINQIWEKALHRRSNDPSGAITMARTLFESTIKHIADEVQVPYSKNNPDIFDLLRKVSAHLPIGPESSADDTVLKIVRGMTTIFEGLGSIRNKYGDAHGRGKNSINPDDRHTELFVNLSGVLCMFLARSHQAKKSQAGYAVD